MSIFPQGREFGQAYMQSPNCQRNNPMFNDNNVGKEIAKAVM